MDANTYRGLLRRAAKQSRRADEAEDLLQAALLAAVEARRADMTRGENRRWLAGVLRNRASHEARSAARRRKRESDYAQNQYAVEEHAPAAELRVFVKALPPALRTTALLALTGHTKPEIAWLLNLSGAAMRKRISEVKRRWRQSGVSLAQAPAGPRGSLPFGLVRRALIGRLHGAALFATHDPDGHLFVVTSQIARARRQGASEV